MVNLARGLILTSVSTRGLFSTWRLYFLSFVQAAPFDDVVIIETQEELLEKFSMWKTNIESKGLQVNIRKTKIMKSDHSAPKQIDACQNPCGVCKKGVGSNSIQCNVTCGYISAVPA